MATSKKKSDTGLADSIAPGNVTAKDLSNMLGIAQSSVSRAFTPDSRISDELRQRIIALADEVGYRPNAIARSLNTKSSGIVALVMGDITNPFYPEVLEAFSYRLQKEGKQLLLFVVPPGRQADDVMPQVLQYQIDAVIVTSAHMSSRTADMCCRRGIPVIFLNRRVKNNSVWSVCCNNARMGESVADYLVERGYRRCAFIAGAANTSTSSDRRRGFVKALGRHGLTLAASLDGHYTYEGGYAAAHALFRNQKNDVDALFCANDIMALGALDYLKHVAKLAVPHDVAVVGFDDIRAAAFPAYNLTTVRQPTQEMIDVTMRLLAEGAPPDQAGKALHEVGGQLITRGTA
ncbi:LacI family DNA-binding transcriptional regulator [Herbaspirillum autotrophicum]|uniref:LacI family DNA-binding transcriptional regulator n=1 Tax=Herbaspirillum autotrophicum TaxID=180195 RepID=UPI00067C3452|nr:LacI family DNA-binding transcriptional regulator [Herbaspirillum autotrophicum]